MLIIKMALIIYEGIDYIDLKPVIFLFLECIFILLIFNIIVFNMLKHKKTTTKLN